MKPYLFIGLLLFSMKLFSQVTLETKTWKEYEFDPFSESSSWNDYDPDKKEDSVIIKIQKIDSLLIDIDYLKRTIHYKYKAGGKEVNITDTLIHASSPSDKKKITIQTEIPENRSRPLYINFTRDHNKLVMEGSSNGYFFCNTFTGKDIRIRECNTEFKGFCDTNQMPEASTIDLSLLEGQWIQINRLDSVEYIMEFTIDSVDNFMKHMLRYKDENVLHSCMCDPQILNGVMGKIHTIYAGGEKGSGYPFIACASDSLEVLITHFYGGCIVDNSSIIKLTPDELIIDHGWNCDKWIRRSDEDY